MMIVRTIPLLSLCLCSILFAFTPSKNIQNDGTVTLSIEVTNIKNTIGTIQVAVYKDAATYEKENPYKTYAVKKTEAGDGSLSFKIELQPGKYGIALLDDENDNKEMDYNFLGIPKEGFGFANYYHSGFSKPTFEDFKLEIKEDQKMVAKLRYI